ncbi:MAG TPA: hypothetical protein VFP66_11070 [Candidatus Limnocylindrales bacterium]|nr:hypothetical protein [Candidatus Limnocylindrales bacterium]
MSRFRRFREDGEPISAGRSGGVASYLDIFRNAMFTVLFFAGVILVNGIIAILLIGFLQSVGLWEGSVSPASEDPMSWLRSRMAGPRVAPT